jgi:Cell Wall Hydrolase
VRSRTLAFAAAVPTGIWRITMLTSLLHEVRIWPVLWRRRLAFYWMAGEKDGLVFFGVVASVIAAIAAIVCFAYAAEPRLAPVQVAATTPEVADQRALELRCLAENIYFEARGEPVNGQVAVAEVTLNRLHSPNFPRTICDVVHEKGWDPARKRFVAHFSWTGQPDHSAPAGPAWKQAQKIASAAYNEIYAPEVPGALFYHTTSVHPAWAKTRKAIATIGNHIFYQ